MKAPVICAALLASVAVVAHAQTTTAPTSSATKNNKKSITITGCIAEDASNAGRFTLADFTTGSTTYRLSGLDIRQYLGKRVSVTGAQAPPKVAISGGLTPSPNVAAQAGALDPTRAAMAAQGAEGNTKPGAIAIPELRVKSVRAIAGGCEHK